MKNLTKLLLAGGFILAANNASSQISFGAKLNFDKYLGGSGINVIGLGVTGEKELPKGSARISLAYGLPSKYQDTYYATAYSSTTSPNQVDVDAETKIGFMGLYLDYKYYFGGRTMDDGGFYGFLGLAANLATLKTTLSDYDDTQYYVSGFEESNDAKEVVFQPMIRAGLGFEIDLGNMYVPLELGIMVPANQANGVAIAVNIPPALHVSAGLRF